MRDIPAARTACHAAVVAAQSEEKRLSGSTSNSRSQPNQELAVYSNRAVLCDVEEDPAGAARDLAQAALFAPDARCVRRNQAATEQVDPSSAQVSAR